MQVLANWCNAELRHKVAVKIKIKNELDPTTHVSWKWLRVFSQIINMLCEQIYFYCYKILESWTTRKYKNTNT